MGISMKILLFALALVTDVAAVLTAPISPDTVALVTVQTQLTLPNWRAP
jgi:hypothetical protein